MSQTPITEHYAEKKYEKMSKGRRDGLLALLGNFSGKQILDIGCANGALGVILKDVHPCTITGVDVSPEAGEKAKEVLDRVYIFDIEDDQAWPADLSAGQEKYDAIIISEVLEHLFAPEMLLRKVRVFADASTDVIVTIPNLLFWKNRLNILRGNFEYTERGLMDRGHIHFFSWKSFVDMVGQENFHIVDVAHHVPTRGTQSLSNYFPGLFAHNFIVKLRKSI
jgi:SAM-dependent methyltransferase